MALSRAVAARQNVVILGRNALAGDVAIALRAQQHDVTVVATSAGLPGIDRDAAVCDPASPACSRELAELLLRARPTTLAVLAFSESPVTPESPWLADAALADAIASALERVVQHGGSAPALLLLSSTAVYGVASGSPLVFDECSSLPHENVFGSSAARWAQGLRDVEKKLVLWAVQNGAGVGVLRTASVIDDGGTNQPARQAPQARMDSPWAALLRSRVPLRILGYDPPCQLIAYDDLVAAVVLAIVRGCGEVLNIVGGQAVPLSRLLALAGVLAPPLPGPIADRIAPAAVDGQRLRWRTLADGRRATELLGFEPSRSAEDCLLGTR